MKTKPLDVMITSCARPDLLEIAMDTFTKHIKTNYQTRVVLIEDAVDNPKRQEIGQKWIQQNIKYFDEVHFLPQKVGIGRQMQEVLKRVKSNIFLHIEDDTKFIRDIDIDPLIDILCNQHDLCEIVFRRDIHNVHTLGKVKIDNFSFVEADFFSDSAGLFKTKHFVDIVNLCGWDTQLHEFGVLTPASRKLKYKKYILGDGEVHYIHNGKQFRRGSWRI